MAASAETSRTPNGLTFWCVSDNLRKGAAPNAVRIAELLAKHKGQRWIQNRNLERTFL